MSRSAKMPGFPTPPDSACGDDRGPGADDSRSMQQTGSDEECSNTHDATQYDTPGEQESSCCSSSALWDWPEMHQGPTWSFRRQASKIDMHAKDTLLEVFGALWRQTHMQTELVRFDFGGAEPPIHAHRSILALKSVVFKKMLESENFTEARSGRIRIRDCSRDTFKSFIACMYGQDDGNSATDGRLMWELADKYQVESIRDMLLATIDESNVAAAAQYGYETGSDDIMMAAGVAAGECLGRIPKESLEGVRMEVALSLMAAYHPGGLPCYSFVERWFAVNKAIGDTDTLIRAIDFGKVSMKDLVGVVQKGGLIDKAHFKTVYDQKAQRLQAAPWSSNKMDPSFNAGCQGMSPGKFQNPVGAAVSPDGAFVVADRDNQRVQMFAGDGRYFKSIGQGGLGDREFLVPVGVACDKHARIFVIDSAQHKVKVFTRDGDFVDCFGQQGTDQGQLLVPIDAAVDEMTGNVAVCEYHNNRVSIFSPGFSFLYTVGTFGEEVGQFKHPSGVAYLPDGKLAVVDQGNFRIQIFEGATFVRAFGEKGANEGQFTLITAIAIAPDGDFVVSDVGRQQVLVFSPEGAFAQALSPSTSPARLTGSPLRERSPVTKPPPVTPDGRFIAPEGVAVGSGGTILVVDGGAHNFHVYETSV